MSLSSTPAFAPVEEKGAQLERHFEHVHAWTGNHVGLSEVSAANLRRLRRERPPVVEELRRDAITVVGPDATELLGTTR